jgi:hypothetical protein
MTITIADVLSEIKRQLDWRGPNGKPQGHIVLPRDQAEYLHQATIAVIIERDNVITERERQ